MLAFRSRSMLPAVVALALAACSGGDDDDGDHRPTTDGPASRSDGASMTQLDPADCPPFAANAVSASAACGMPVPGGGEATLEGYCRKGITAAATCGGDPQRGLECFRTPDPTDWVCAPMQLGGGAYPACNGDLAAALGMYCLIALGNPQCASGIRCDYNSDCSDGLSCNGATGQCFAQNAYCVGLPCQYNADCPTGHTCNGAEGACIAQ